MLRKRLIIAVDGYASSGKSTLAKDLAKVLNYKYIDTGAMYRGITFFSIQQGCFHTDRVLTNCLKAILKDVSLTFQTINGKNHLFLNGYDVEENIRSIEVTEKVSDVSTIDFVRHFLVSQQREIGKSGGIVMDGRDIGTVVFPHADIKFFVQADIDERSKRRFNEMKDKYSDMTIHDVKKSLIIRDNKDTTRSISPLKRAKNSILIDNTKLDRETQLKYALQFVKGINRSSLKKK